MTEQGRPDPEPTQPIETPATPPPPAPLVAWEAPPAASPALASSVGSYDGGPPPFTIGALLSDTFARYGADLLRLFLVSAAASALSWLSSFASIGSNPFVRPGGSGFVDVSGLLSLASFVVGLIGSSTLFALAEGGRTLPFGRAIRRGVERAGWLFLTTLLLGLAFLVVLLLALIPIALFAFISPVLVIVPLVIVFLVFAWAGLRLSLALPANVVDNLNSIEAVKLSWRITKPSGVWLRLLGAAFLLGLLVAPAAIGAVLLIVPAMFSGGDQLLLLLLPSVAFAVFTPLSALMAFSAYRRLVSPLQPSWTDLPAAPAPIVPPSAPGIDAPPPALGATAEQPVIGAPATEPTFAAAAEATPAIGEPAAPSPAAVSPAEASPTAPAGAAAAPAGTSTPAFRVPALGTAAKGLLALVLAFDVAGLVAIPYGVAAMERFVREGFPGFPGFPGGPGSPTFPGGDGFVFPGQVAFGTAADLSTCTVQGQTLFVTAGTPVEWIASLETRVTPQDEVFLRVTQNGEVLETTLQDPGTYDCLGSDDPVPGLAEGVYSYDVIVNGSIKATGSLFVQ